MADPSMRPAGESTDVPAIRMSNITMAYGDLVVLKSLDLTVPAGQKLAIIGRSGSGKTTLLRLLMTLERAHTGTIEIEGDLLGMRRVGDKFVQDDSRHVRQVRGKIGMVFQQFNLFPRMTALGNVMEAPIQVLGRPKETARSRALSLLEVVGLSEKANEYPRNLSGGQQQRVAIARALAMEPRIMLFDEITSALDPELVGEVLKVVRHVASETSMTMLIVTHEMNFARDVSDRVIFMEDGEIAEDAPPDIMFSSPSNPRTRSFLRAVLEH